MTLVVDASVAVKWLVRETLTEQARGVIAAPDPLIAPDWILVEAANSFWKKVKKSELLMVHAERHLRDLPEFFEQLYPAADLIGEALTWSFRLQHPVYDCLYLALAQREQARLVTADAKFARTIAQHDVSVTVELLA